MGAGELGAQAHRALRKNIYMNKNSSDSMSLKVSLASRSLAAFRASPERKMAARGGGGVDRRPSRHAGGIAEAVGVMGVKALEARARPC